MRVDLIFCGFAQTICFRFRFTKTFSSVQTPRPIEIQQYFFAILSQLRMEVISYQKGSVHSRVSKQRDGKPMAK